MSPPWTAAALSFLVPGLGQLYSGHVRRAAFFYVLPWLVALPCGVLIVKLPLPFGLNIALPLVAMGLLRFVFIPRDALVRARHAVPAPSSWVRRWYVWGAAVIVEVALVETVLTPAVGLPIVKSWMQSFRVPAGSMSDTLLPGDYILVDMAAYRLTNPLSGAVAFEVATPRRGDVVVFPAPGDPARPFVKRVIGLPGERVELRNNVVHIDGTPLAEPYVRPADDVGDFGEYLQSYRSWGPRTVPAGQLFVLGDWRDNSRDSRIFGFVPIASVAGRVRQIYWSQEMGRGAIRWRRIGRRVD